MTQNSIIFRGGYDKGFYGSRLQQLIYENQSHKLIAKNYIFYIRFYKILKDTEINVKEKLFVFYLFLLMLNFWYTKLSHNIYQKSYNNMLKVINQSNS